jgi:hypothetical protein
MTEHKTWQQKQLEYIQAKYESSKKLAEEIWINGDYEGSSNDFYYFQCGFVAGLNYERHQKTIDTVNKLNELDQELGFQ